VTVTTKAALHAELLAVLGAALETARAAHAAAVDGAINEEARAENPKDTRGLEQSYLARGIAQRVAELEAAVAETGALALRAFGPRAAVAMSALVTVDEDGADARFFLAPHGGGTVLGGGVQVVTPGSPLGRALLGKTVDDDVQVALRDRTRSFAITAIE
jgi:transcription elongation GreA/GreB family factor